MDSARHVIKCILNPHFLSYMASYDVASTIHQSLIRGMRNSTPADRAAYLEALRIHSVGWCMSKVFESCVESA